MAYQYCHEDEKNLRCEIVCDIIGVCDIAKRFQNCMQMWRMKNTNILILL